MDINQAFIFSVSGNDAEHNYDYMSLILTESIAATNPGADVYCGVLTDHQPDTQLIKELETRCNVVVDPKFKVTGHRDYCMRPATCDYFSYLLKKYDQLVYIDIDAVISNRFTYQLPENSFLHERWTDFIFMEVEKCIPEFHTFPWLSIVNESNKHVYKEHDPVRFMEGVRTSGLTLVPNDFTTIYYYRPYKPEHLAFHYDGFNYCGYAYKLSLLPFWDKLRPIVMKYFNFDRIKVNYWERRLRCTQEQM